MNSRFINQEIIKKCAPKLKISFSYGTTILETPKTVKSKIGIFEECKGTGRKV